MSKQDQMPKRGSEPAEESGLPPRRKSHPSQKGKLTAWFYRTLLALFILLTGSLLFWGYHSFE